MRFCSMLWMAILAFCTLTACMSTTSSDTAVLVTQDYTQMTDAELIRYEQQLNDELNRSVSSSGSDVSIGFGFGSWGGHSGYGVNTSQRVGATDSNQTVELRNRRDQVRTEMRRRGLIE